MIWQEYVFLAGSALQVVLLVPMARQASKPPYASSVPIAAVLAAYALTFATLGQWLSTAAMAGVTAMWLLLALQRWRNRRRLTTIRIVGADRASSVFKSVGERLQDLRGDVLVFPRRLTTQEAAEIRGALGFALPECTECNGSLSMPVAGGGTACPRCYGVGRPHWQGVDPNRLDWVIVGGESGPRHRPFDPAWARRIVAQCREAGVACFIKQLGGARPGNKLEDLPEDLRVREWPR